MRRWSTESRIRGSHRCLTVDYRESQLRGIVAFELRAEKMYAKAKLSQNRTMADRLRVIENLKASANQIDRECAAEMTRAIRTPVMNSALMRGAAR